LADAKRIEQESWQTTNDLIAAFEEDMVFSMEEVEEKTKVTEEAPIAPTENAVGELCEALGDWLAFARAVLNGDVAMQRQEAERLGKMRDWIVDEINGIAADVIGDILIDGDGDEYTVIEDYRDML
jgi:hypothetical protein